MSVVDRAHVRRWVAAYERAWRTAGTDELAELFTDDATYRPSPWARSVEGRAAIAAFWERARDAPDEAFAMTSEIVAVDGDTAVVRVAVDYTASGAGRWRDLWVVQFGAGGRCAAFEEWPFAPGQHDGHEQD